MIELRDYQELIVRCVRDHMVSGIRSVLIQAPTGSGKTALTAHMLNKAAAKGNRSWFIVHRRELIKQSVETFNIVGLEHGIISAGFDEQLECATQICSIQTLARRFHKLSLPNLVVWDECHHIAAKSWSKIRQALPESYHIGLTATPERLDGRGLGTWFEKMIQGPSVSRLIKEGWLSKYRLFAPSIVDLRGVHSRMGDYITSEVSEAVDKPSITGNAVEHYKKLGNGKRALVFCASVQHSMNVCSSFRGVGIPAEHVDGDTPKTIRDAAMKRFRSGETLILTNCELFGEGVNVPGATVAVLLKPTQSLTIHLQQIGRVLRPDTGKDEAIILDHAGNTARHGLPDEIRQWSLESKARKTRDKPVEASVKICPHCFAAQFPGPVCRFCGHIFEIKPRKIEEVDGELVEICKKLDRIKERKNSGSLEDLVQLGIRRGYKHPRRWAQYVWQGRQRKKYGS